MPGESKTSPRRIAAVEKQRQALELRKAGTSFESIAKALGYRDRRGAHMAVEAAMRKTIQEPADQQRRLDIERLDSMLMALAPQSRAGDATAINTALRVMERRAKLLGLDFVPPLPGSSRDRPLFVQSTDAVDLSTASDADLDAIIERAEAIREAGRILQENTEKAA